MVFALFYGTQSALTLIFTSIDGIHSKGKVIETLETRTACGLNRYDYDCHRIKVEYNSGKQSTYIDEDTIDPTYISSDNKIDLIYSKIFPFFNYFDGYIWREWIFTILFLGGGLYLLPELINILPFKNRKHRK